jgi:pyruvate-ferredoxin/flavodoxin oxidoreductase
MPKKMKMMDGNMAASHVSYAFTEVAGIYPITPSSPMAETVDEWAAEGRKNIFGQPVKVIEMQSEAGAAGVVHGSLAAGALTTTYTASQGLLLMIPNMYKIAGELLPGVFHVSARALASHALSIFGDHQDVMACRETGVTMLASSNVQEVMDLGAVAHLAAISSSIPVLHFFDGFRTSHEYQKIEPLNYEDLARLVDYEALERFRSRSLNPNRPILRGTAQNPDIFFQNREASNRIYEKVPDTVLRYMQEINKLTGRDYKPFNYYGAEDAEYVIVAMGSVCDTIQETVDYLNEQGEKTGAIFVHLYRPFHAPFFFDVLPKTVKRIAVLDRTKEPGAPGEPLYLDVVSLFYQVENKPEIFRGRYGLGSKDTRPSQIVAVFENLKKDTPKDGFTIGIVDDVTFTSLEEKEDIETTPKGTVSCKFWGLGSDGTVGANKTAVKIIGDKTDLYAQAYFSYDSKKSGGSTVSHLRFGPKPLRSPYLVYNADYIACHNPSFVNQMDLVKGLKKNGTFVLNCPWTVSELEEKLPASLKRYLARNNIQFHIIDAISIAGEVGLGNRINMVMQSVFFKLANVIPTAQAIAYLKESVEQMYGSKGEKIVQMNIQAIDRSLERLYKVTVPEEWAYAEDPPKEEKEEPEFIKKIARPMARHEGDELPVSAFIGMEDGSFPTGTTSYEKRGIAVFIPEWQIDNCIQCNQCAYICPHAVIRPLLLTQEENDRAPEGFLTLKGKGKGLDSYYYRIQISPLDCTGCGNCADICPAPTKALIMKDAEEQIRKQADLWEYGLKVTEKTGVVPVHTVKGSQFSRPLFEFHGACPGCGETPYIKLITQLFGDRMIIANATGCSSIYGGSAPSIPYTVNKQGKGPAWGNSLFEDNAEYGYGMFLGTKALRERIADLMEKAIEEGTESAVAEVFREWIENMDDGEETKRLAPKILSILEDPSESDRETFREIYKLKDYLIKPSPWIIGGDGWAYDIGYGGLDHVLATGDDVNILVLDTEVYSNTGGQSSKATPAASVSKFASGGKKTRKKDLGLMAMSYGYVYVAQIAIGADMNQTLKAFLEAEKYKGPSLIIAYSPCVNHGIKAGMGKSLAQEKKAVEAGYWHLYRYNPALKEEGKNPFVLDSKDPKADYKEYLKGEIRYARLASSNPAVADEMYEISEKHAKERLESYKKLAETKNL